jgi:hypothetical protein
MTTTKILLSIGFVALAVTPAARAEERLRSGQWEIIFTGDNPHTTTTCFTPAMTQGMNGTVDAVRADIEKTAAKRKFTVEGYKFDGTTLSYTAVGAIQGQAGWLGSGNLGLDIFIPNCRSNRIPRSSRRCLA